MVSAPRPIEEMYFGTAPLYGVLHATAATGGRGFVVCAPFGHAELGTHRPLAELGRQLALGGTPALTFDWPGYGESAGRDSDPGQLEAFRRAVTEAIDLLVERTGVGRVTVLGVGVGGLLAAAGDAAGHPAWDELVLWGVPADGRAFVREQRAFQGLSGAGPEPEHHAALDPGALEVSGFVLPADLVAALEALRFERVPPGVVRTLEIDSRRRRPLLTPDGAEAAYEALALGAADALFESPGTSELDARVAPALLSWTATGDAPPAPGTPAPPPARTATLARCTEQLVDVEGPAGWMVGTLTRPLDAQPSLAVLLLNAGAVRRSGPNRLWALWARHWAERGIATLRVDASGVGDSDGAAVNARTFETLCTEELLVDARVWLQTLARHVPETPIVPIGLCSGAFAAFRLLVEDEALPGGVLLNLQTNAWDSREWELDMALHARKALARRSLAETLRDVRRHGYRASLGLAWGQATDAATRAFGRSRRASRTAEVAGRFAEELTTLSSRGAEALFVYSADDPGIAFVDRRLGSLDGLTAHGARVEIVDGADHTFREVHAHPIVLGAVDRHLELLAQRVAAP